MAGFGHNVLPIITRLSFHSSIIDNIHLLQCEFKLMRLSDNENFIYNCHTYTRDLPLLSIHSTIHLVHHAQQLTFVLSRADLIHKKPACARNLSSITVNRNHSSYADGFIVCCGDTLLRQDITIFSEFRRRLKLKKGGRAFLFCVDIRCNE
jgi:hypothetical protein